MTQQTEAATVTVTDGLKERSAATVALINELKLIRTERQALLQVGLFDGAEDTKDECLAAFDERELEIRNEIRKLTSKRPLVRKQRDWMEVPLWGPDAGETSELIEDEPEGESEDDTLDT